MMIKAEYRHYLEQGALACALLWCEIVFKASTTGSFWPQLCFVLLFSLAAGTLANVLLSFLPSRRANKVGKIVVMALTGIVFCIEYFVYREFKIFYDLNTVTAGAGDAATGFTDQIVGLVLSVSGIVHIALFMAPSVLYGIFGTGQLLGEETDDVFATRVRLARDGVIVHLLALLLVSCMGTFAHAYSDQYSFQSAVTNFGLFTGLRLEVQHAVSGSTTQVSFTSKTPAPAAPEDPESTQPEKSQESTTPPATSESDKSSSTATSPDKDKESQKEQKTYPKNALDIDFASLAQDTSGTWAELDTYVNGLTPSSQNEMTGRFKGYNLIFISAEALSSEAIREDTTPTLWRLAHKGIQFTDYYQFDSAGTTGGECANIFGLLATEGGSSVKNTVAYNNYYTMGNALNRLGYNGWAFHNNTYTYYSRDLTHNNLGYNNGFMGYGNGMEQWVTWQWPQSDLEMMQGTFENTYGATSNEPFNVYYMSVSGHSGYLPGENAMSEKNQKAVASLPYSDAVKGYLACNIELDKALEYLVAKLEEKGMADHTAIVIGSDHFPYGLDEDGALGSLPYTSELYGYNVETCFQRDHNRLIIWSESLEKEAPLVVNEPTSSVDILPTLLNLFGCEWDSRLLPGRDVFSDKAALAFSLEYDWKSSLGSYMSSTGAFVPNEGAKVPDGYVEATNADVANRINYCRGVLTSDYYRHVFGDPADVQEIHDSASRPTT